MPIRYGIENPQRVRVEWYDVDGRPHTDWFSTRAGLPASQYAEMSYWHIYEDPVKGVRKFLSHLPLHNVKIELEF